MKIAIDDYINKTYNQWTIIPYNDYEIIDKNYLKNKIMEVYTL